jgi:hypothetical protein
MIRRLLVLIALGGSGIGCGSKEPSGPVGGDLTVSYSGPSANDGALLVLVTGAVDAVNPVGAYPVASAPVGVGSHRVVITGALVPGDLFRITVKDVSLTYQARVEAAADRTTFALNDPGSYSAAVRR